MLVKFINDEIIVLIESFSSRIALRSISGPDMGGMDLAFPELISSIGPSYSSNDSDLNSFLISTWNGAIYEATCVLPNAMVKKLMV